MGNLHDLAHRVGINDEVLPSVLTNAAIKAAPHVTVLELVNNRLVPNAMEPRAAIGEFDSMSGDYTLYTTSQNPHVIRLLMGAFVLAIPESKLRVVAPDVGGGFGSKIYHYAEEAIVTWAAAKLGRAVKWTADRTEAFLADAHGRDGGADAAQVVGAASGRVLLDQLGDHIRYGGNALFARKYLFGYANALGTRGRFAV